MIDIKLLRDNPDQVRTALSHRSGNSLVDLEKALELDKRWREVLSSLEELRAKRNKAADEIGRLKKAKKDASSIIKEMEELKSKFKAQEELERERKHELDQTLMGIPNLPDESVPVGKSEKENKLMREVGTKPRFDFTPRDHHDVGSGLGILDFETAAKLSGAGFAVYKNEGARLERAIINFMLDIHTKEFGYQEVSSPYLVSAQTMTNTGQLPKFAEDLYKTKDDDLYLIPTSEVTLANLFRDQALTEDQLPIGVTSFTPCFRREAGSYGKDVRGLIRNHQFTKVELVRVCKIEDSLSELEKLTSHAEEILKRLELPYRVMTLSTGDMGFAAAKTYDLEVWMPGYDMYREISSCSTCGDFQARRLNFKVKADKKRRLGCTLNGSGLAVGRTLAAILENGQQKDGSVRIPKALQPYFGSDTIQSKAGQ